MVRVIEPLRKRIQRAVLEPFSHGSNPLAATLQHTGDPGLFGPDTVTWPVVGDISALFGGVRALLIQFAHPEVAAGMVDFSSHERDPHGRISRTTDYVAATRFGAMPEVEQALAAVRRAHRVVKGASHRNLAHTADDADLSAWVHNALSDSFLSAYEHFGPAASPLPTPTDLRPNRYGSARPSGPKIFQPQPPTWPIGLIVVQVFFRACDGPG